MNDHINCVTCQHFRWNTGTTFDAWCSEGHGMAFTTPAQAPDGCMAHCGWTREGCEDYDIREGDATAKARPNDY